MRSLAPASLGLLAGITLSQIGGGFTGGSNGPYIVVVSDRYGTPASSLWWIASAFGFALLFVALAGTLLLRLPAVTLLRVGAALGAAGSAVLATTPVIPVIAAASTATGLSGALMLLATLTLLRGAPGGVSLVMAFASLAGLAAPPAVGALELAGMPGGWAMLAPVPFLAVLAVCGIRPSEAAAQVPEDGPVARPGAATRLDGTGALLAWAATVLVVMAEFCFSVWGVARLVDAGLSTGAASVVGVSFPVGMVAGRFAGARLRSTGHGSARLRLRVAGLGVAVATVAVVAGPVAVVAAGLLVAGLALATTYPTALSLLAATPGLALRTAMTAGTAASGVAIVAAPLGLGVLASVLSLRTAFLLPLGIVAALLVLTLPRTAVGDAPAGDPSDGAVLHDHQELDQVFLPPELDHDESLVLRGPAKVQNRNAR